MSEHYDHGPLHTFEVTWANGHVEHVRGHQCTVPNNQLYLPGPDMTPRWQIHGEFDGRWQLVLTAPEADIRIVRNLSHETTPGGVS